MDTVVSHFQGDKEQLLLLSLVSVSWFISSRRHLFRSIRVKGVGPAHRNIEALPKVLHCSPPVFHHIQELSIESGDINLPALLPALLQLTQLRQLYLQFLLIQVPSTVTPLPEFTSPPLRGIELLQLSSCRIHGHPRSLFELIRAFPSISELAMSRLWSTWQCHQDPGALQPPPFRTHIKSFVYRSPNTVSSEVLDGCLQMMDECSLETLVIELVPQMNTRQQYASLIRAASRNLKTLILDVDNLSKLDPAPPPCSWCHTRN